jgi:hypothetical protein
MPSCRVESAVSLQLKVECYSGYKADERPVRFCFGEKPGAQVFEVREVLDQWYGPGYQCFKVLADDGNFYILRHHQEEDSWVLDSFRRDAGKTSE